jgi:predicted DNA-binding transcriptional regulator AlpA
VAILAATDVGAVHMSERGFDDLWPKKNTPDHDSLIPPWQDMATLCKHISCSPSTVEKWVADGTLPPPRKRGGESLWKWSEVDEYLTYGGHQAADIDRIREATRRIVEGTATATDSHAATTQSPPKAVETLLDSVARSYTLFVTDTELIQRLGVPEQLGLTLLQDFDARHPTFPKKLELWGDRRYWPAVKAWLDKTCALDLAAPPPRKNSRTKKR